MTNEKSNNVSRNEKDAMIKYETNSSNKKLMTSHELLKSHQEYGAVSGVISSAVSIS